MKSESGGKTLNPQYYGNEVRPLLALGAGE